MSLDFLLYTLPEGAMCRNISPMSEIRVDVQRKTGHLFLAKSRETNELIDLQGLFKDYWASEKRQFTVPSQS